MNNNIKQIVDKYRYDQGLRTYSNKHYFKTGDTIHRQIRNKEDVERAKNGIEYDLDFFNKTYPLHRDDIVQIEKDLGEYEIAICKVLQCYNIIDFDYNTEELQRLIDNRYMYEKKLNDIRMKLMCQD